MRIFFVTTEYIDCNSLEVIDGGLANYLYRITRVLKSMGHDINVIVSSSVNKKISFNGINVEFIDRSEFKKTFLQKIFWGFTTKKQRRRVREDCLTKYLIPHKLKLENKKKKIDIIQYASYLGIGRFPLKNIPSCLRISSWARVHQFCYGVHNENEINFETLQIQNSRFIFGPSVHIAKILERDLNLKKNIKIIESPYLDETFEFDYSVVNEIKAKTDGKPYLLFFGSIGKLKGCKEIADCIYDVLEKYPDLYFVLMGKNIDTEGINYRELIISSAKQYKDRVLDFKAQPHNILYPVIENSYGVVIPSRTENFANACVEAMRLRKIVIGTEENFSQLITDGENGYLARVADSKSLEEKITALLNLSKENKRVMEEKAFKTTERLNPEVIAQKLLAYYKYVIKNWKKEKEYGQD